MAEDPVFTGFLEHQDSTTHVLPLSSVHLLPEVHFERRLIAERTKDGIESARLKGKRLGRPPLDNEKLVAAFKLIEAGISPAHAAKQLTLGRSTLYREIQKKKA